MSYIEKSPWIIHFDGSGCSGCSAEVRACFTPMYDLEQYGIKKTNNPKHADVLLVTGIIDEENRALLESIYEQMLSPKKVVAVGACACSGGIFESCSSVLGSVDSVIPVDVYVPGCAAGPAAITDGILKSFDTQEQREPEISDTEDVTDTEEASENDEKKDEKEADDNE